MLNSYLQRFKSDKYHYSIDILRGVAALMVVTYHFIAIKGRFSDFWLLQKIVSFGHLGVQVFFVISGFVIPNAMYRAGYKINDFGRFMLKRLARLEPPYIASIVICIILAYVSTLSPYYRGKPLDISWPQALLHIGYLNTFFKYDWLNVVYWSLAIEFQFYILMGLLFSLIISEKKYQIIFICAFIYLLSYSFREKELIFRHAPFFLFGISLFLLKIEKIDTNSFFVFVVINCVVCYYLENPVYALVGIATTLVIALTSLRIKIGMFLGSISYSLYLLHVPVGQRLINISQGFIHSQLLLLIVVVLVTFVMIGISYVYYRLVEMPSQNLSKQMSLKKRDED